MIQILSCFCFFFPSRRRHTRWPRDWSSDVCSSDLLDHARQPVPGRARMIEVDRLSKRYGQEIGRASCREREYVLLAVLASMTNDTKHIMFLQQKSTNILK